MAALWAAFVAELRYHFEHRIRLSRLRSLAGGWCEFM
jgi:hypothetical protein